MLTLSRIFMVPIIIFAMLSHAWGFACLLFTLAAITDVLDGTLARLLQQETKLGAYLDPLADKFLLLSCYTSLAFIKSPLFTIPVWFVLVVLIKELILIAGAIYFGLVKKSITIRATMLGKITTVIQILFMWWLFFCAFYREVSVGACSVFLISILVITGITLMHYILISYKKMGLKA